MTGNGRSQRLHKIAIKLHTIFNKELGNRQFLRSAPSRWTKIREVGDSSWVLVVRSSHPGRFTQQNPWIGLCMSTSGGPKSPTSRIIVHRSSRLRSPFAFLCCPRTRKHGTGRKRHKEGDRPRDGRLAISLFLQPVYSSHYAKNCGMCVGMKSVYTMPAA